MLFQALKVVEPRQNHPKCFIHFARIHIKLFLFIQICVFPRIQNRTNSLNECANTNIRHNIYLLYLKNELN